jgi:hypothetical protein
MMPLVEARRAAEEVVASLRPVCDAIVVAGSVRREKSFVKDIEIVARVADIRFTPEFGKPAASAFEAKIAELLDQRLLAAAGKNGPLYKKFRMPSYGIAVDLFLTRADNWGNILAIRTGDADFSKLLVTHRYKGGLMPDGLVERGGYLHEIRDVYGQTDKLACPDEETFFRALGIERVPDPKHRSLALGQALRESLRQKGAA